MLRRVLSLTAAVLLSIGIASSANAEEVPFFVVGQGDGPIGFSVGGVPSPFSNNGISFPLGRYRGPNGIAISQSFDPVAGEGTFKGSFTFKSRRGSLVTTFGDPDNGAAEIGTYQAIPARDGLIRVLFIAEFNPVLGESTGAFADVSGGSLIMYALTEPIPLQFDELGFSVPFEFNWIGTGHLEFDDD